MGIMKLDRWHLQLTMKICFKHAKVMVSKKTGWISYDLTNNHIHYTKRLETFDVSNTPKAILWGQMQLQGGAFRQ